MNVYRSSDGPGSFSSSRPTSFVAVVNGRSAGTDLLTDPRFSSPAQIMANMTQLTAIFDEVFGAQAMAHWHSVFAGVNVTFGEVRGPQEVINDPQLAANEIVVPLDGAGGKLTSTITQSDPGARRHQGSGAARAATSASTPRRSSVSSASTPGASRACAKAAPLPKAARTRGMTARNRRTRKHTMSDIITERSDGILRVELNRPAQKNAMTGRHVHRPRRHLRGSCDEDETVRVVLWHGAGDAFCAGNDIGDFLRIRPGRAESPQSAFDEMRSSRSRNRSSRRCKALAIGGGTTMLTHCDFVYAGESAEVQAAVHRSRHWCRSSDRAFRCRRASGISGRQKCSCWASPSRPRGRPSWAS